MGTTESGMTDHGALVLADVAREPLRKRIAELEAENQKLKQALAVSEMAHEARRLNLD